jgi:hypothetical protein
MNDYDFQSITDSTELSDLRTYGFYVREQVEAHGGLMPEWLLESLTERCAEKVDEATGFLAFDVGLGDIFTDEELRLAIDSISVKDMPLDLFREFIEEITKQRLDGDL